FLLLLTGERLRGWQKHRWASVVCLIILGATAIYGLGTLAALMGHPQAPQSSIVPYILKDVIGWRAFGPTLSETPGNLFVIDYNAAGQAAYYADRPAFTSWGQYRLWGYPAMDKVTVIAREFLSADHITRELHATFETVSKPEVLRAVEHGVTRELWIWQAEDRYVPQEIFLKRFDFLTLLQETP
ncbi:MAG: hypothetical protein ACP5JJ_18575, partial [Anaerolineae bacterium]